MSKAAAQCCSNATAHIVLAGLERAGLHLVRGPGSRSGGRLSWAALLASDHLLFYMQLASLVVERMVAAAGATRTQGVLRQPPELPQSFPQQVSKRTWLQPSVASVH